MSVATLLLRAEQARSVVPSLVVAEDPNSRFSLASKAALEGSSADLEGWRVTHETGAIRQRSNSGTVSCLATTFPPVQGGSNTDS